MSAAARVLALSLAVASLTGCSVLSDALGEGEQGVFTLAVGDCLNDDTQEGEVSTIPVVDCDEPHDSEVYASVLMDDGDYPGEDATVAFADEQCTAQFEAFVGLSPEESKYGYGVLYPTAQSWAGGDREVLCRIVLGDGNGNTVKVTGSLENADE